MRVLHYAMGGGLGHRVRADAFLRMQGWHEQALVLSATVSADDRHLLGGIATCQVPDALNGDPAAFRDWLAAQIQAWRPQCMVIDTFPCGILGELNDALFPPEIPLWHLARRLRWNAYQPLIRGRPPRYARSLRLEPLEPEHEAFLAECSDQLIDFELDYPQHEISADRIPADPFWLIVHSGPMEEVAQLIEFAAEMRRIEQAPIQILVASPCCPERLPEGVAPIAIYPAAALFPHAQRIISAGGYNVMRQAAPFRDKHRALPFPRRFDDQFARVREALQDSSSRRKPGSSSGTGCRPAPG